MRATARLRGLLAVAATALLLAGCASSGPEFGSMHRGHYGAGRPHYTVAPYQINGVWYYPKVDYGYDRTGTASWYGPGFDQHATADGEIYDMNALSAAHKTLPLPSVVEVTNLQNGREVRLRVNDRGPFVGDRLIDVSRRAAQLLGFERYGTAPVRVRVLRDESIQVAEAAMLGETGPVGVGVGVGVAAAPRAVRTEVAVAAPPPVVVRQPVSSPPAPAPVQVAAAEPARQFLHVSPPPAAAPPVPFVAEPAPRLASPPPPARKRYFPSLIAPAEAETLHPAMAEVAAAERRPGRIFVQAGAFAVPENAQRVRARIATLGRTEIVPAAVHGASLYRVRLGPVTNEAEARRLLGKVMDSGYPGARLVDQ